MKRKVASRKYPFCEKYSSGKEQWGSFSWRDSCSLSKKKNLLREASRRIEVVSFLLFFPVFLAFTLRFMTAYTGPSRPVLEYDNDSIKSGQLTIGVSISKCEKCTLSKTECLADLLLWLPKRIEGEGFEVWSVCSLYHPLWEVFYHECSSGSTS